ncbi:sialic acid-binding Ig-like lectin 13 isoform X1 [Phyllostomus hastatus]|uniref:sialic acid-binding Ig-like lectin 13 isoform X1 n=2 Tax=Phyllostomus hastatus TaxID=9423 RepID=UPI001E67EA71|nr:sialic acid-binding Ig-like lectin 13 isoform X1 [Phyllostomus hastatus]
MLKNSLKQVGYSWTPYCPTSITGSGSALSNGSCDTETLTLTPDMLLLLLLLALLWAGSLTQHLGFWLRVQESVMLQEGQCISVPCTVSYPKIGWTEAAPAHGYWFLEGAEPNSDAPVATNNPNRKVRDETRGRFHLVGDPRTSHCSLHIRDAQKRDTGRYFFRVERGSYVKYNYIQKQLSVHVTELVPDIHIQGTLESGHPNNITCTMSWACDRETPPIFYWMGANLTLLSVWTPNSSVLTLTPGPQHHGTNLTCQVALPGGEIRERTIQLNVTYALQNLTIMSWKEGTGYRVLSNGSSLQVQEGKSLHLVCKADSNPPTSTRWTRGSLTLESTDPGVLKLPQVELEDHGKYICRAQQHESASLEASVTLSVKRKSGTRAVVVLVAIVEVAAKTLFLLLCLIILIVRYQRRKVRRPTRGMKHANTESS